MSQQVPKETLDKVEWYIKEKYPFVWPLNSKGEKMVQRVGHKNPPFSKRHRIKCERVAEDIKFGYSLAAEELARCREALEKIIKAKDAAMSTQDLFYVLQEIDKARKAFSSLPGKQEGEIEVEDLQKQVRDHIKSDSLYDWEEVFTGEEMTYLENLLLTFAPMFRPGSIGFEKTVRPYLNQK